MALFKVKCVTDTYDPNAAPQFPDTRKDLIENVYVNINNMGIGGYTSNNGVFSFSSNNETYITNGVPVTLSRGGYVTQDAVMSAGKTTTVVMLTDGEIASRNAVENIFNGYASNVSLVDYGRYENCSIAKLDNLFDGGTGATNALSYKYCIYYRPGHPNVSDKDRILRTSDFIRVRGTPSKLEPVVPPGDLEPYIPPEAVVVSSRTDIRYLQISFTGSDSQWSMVNGKRNTF